MHQFRIGTTTVTLHAEQLQALYMMSSKWLVRAIKLLRLMKPGTGLKEAKDIVEFIRANGQLVDDDRVVIVPPAAVSYAQVPQEF